MILFQWWGDKYSSDVLQITPLHSFRSLKNPGGDDNSSTPLHSFGTLKSQGKSLLPVSKFGYNLIRHYKDMRTVINFLHETIAWEMVQFGRLSQIVKASIFLQLF